MTINSTSRDIARDRLKNVIYIDRTKKLFDEQMINLMKYDIFKAVSKYIDVKENNVKLSFTSDDNTGITLNASICVNNLVSCLRKEKND